MTGLNISIKQYHWLDQQGGRDEDDVEVDGKGMYVWMSSGVNLKKKVYLPDDDMLETFYSSGRQMVKFLGETEEE